MTAAAPSSPVGHDLVDGDPGLVRLLGMCPLLAGCGDAVNALGLGVATVVALTATNIAASALRRASGQDVRLPAFLIVIAAVVTAIDLALRAWLPALHAGLGPTVPLVAAACVLTGRADAVAPRHDALEAVRDGFTTGLVIVASLLAVGALRELVGAGTLFAGAGARLHLPALELHVAAAPGLLLATLPIGAFLVLAAAVAARQRWPARVRGTADDPPAPDSTP